MSQTTEAQQSLPSAFLYMDFEEAMRRIEALCDAIQCMEMDIKEDWSDHICELAGLCKAIAQDQARYQEEEERKEQAAKPQKNEAKKKSA